MDTYAPYFHGFLTCFCYTGVKTVTLRGTSN